jgi:hypothetical protein
MTLMFALVLTVLPSQLPQALSGTWVADLNGRTFIRLELNIVEGRVTGALGTGNIHVDQNGVVDEAEPVPATLTPLSDFETKDGMVSFTRQEGNDPEQFRLRVVAEGRAELILVLSEEDLQELKDDDIPVPKPIPLRKVK